MFFERKEVYYYHDLPTITRFVTPRGVRTLKASFKVLTPLGVTKRTVLTPLGYIYL